jgi:hypothetical protein
VTTLAGTFVVNVISTLVEATGKTMGVVPARQRTSRRGGGCAIFQVHQVRT